MGWFRVWKRLKKVQRRQDALDETLYLILQKLEQVMTTLDDVIAKVAAEKTQLDSFVTLFAGLKQQLADALAGKLSPADQAKVDAIFAGVSANSQEIVDAINAPGPATP